LSRCYKTVKKRLQNAETIKEYILHKTVINFKAGSRHSVASCKKGERKVIFGSKTGTHNLSLGRVFVNCKYVRDVLPMQIILPFAVMLLSIGKGQDRGKDT
jgi:hypothetical protein